MADNTSYDYGVNHAKSVAEQIDQLLNEYEYNNLQKQRFWRGFKEEMEKHDG